MSRMPRRNARGLLGALEGAADVAVASRALRGRVLAIVRAEEGRRTALPRLAGRAAPLRLSAAPPVGLLALSLAAALAWLAVALASPGRPMQRASAVFGGVRGARAVLREAGGDAELNVSGLAPVGAGRAYQVWLLPASGQPRPTDVLFSVTRRGTASVAVPGGVRGVRELLVTSEPRGGSARPSTVPALRVVLPPAGS
jgi:hypothetical protein